MGKPGSPQPQVGIRGLGEVRVRFAEVLSRCVLGSTGYLESAADLARLRQVIELNLPVLRRFPNLVVATNYGPDDAASLRQANAELWRQHVPTAVLLDSPGNRGHSIGTADLDNLLFDWCRAHGAEWLCKTANDVVLRQSIFDIEVARAQFYYLNAVSYDALAERDFDLTLFGAASSTPGHLLGPCRRQYGHAGRQGFPGRVVAAGERCPRLQRSNLGAPPRLVVRAPVATMRSSATA